MLRSEAIISTEAIEDALSRSLACLRSNFRIAPGGAAGWYHYLDDPHPGVTASAVGLYCFSLAAIRFERTDAVIEYLLSQQVTGAGSGGWPVRTTSGVPLVEATAWVLRALSRPGLRPAAASEAIAQGAKWLEDNQNTDYGWGSYLGQPSRVFTTALSILALEECGGSSSTIDNAHKWLIEAQSQNQPAWGPLPGTEPTLLHTSFSLMALLGRPAALPTTAVKSTVNWLLNKFQPEMHTERSTTVEEYDVPYLHGASIDTFQNSLPHFAGPVTLAAVLRAGADPLQLSIFDAVNAIISAQEKVDPQRSGSWELPRSPLRASIWAIWPFVAALATARDAICPAPNSTATLLYRGCAIVQAEGAARQLTRRLLIRNALLDWLRERRLAVALWAVACITVLIPVILWLYRQLTLTELLVTMALPVLLLIFQILWDRRTRRA